MLRQTITVSSTTTSHPLHLRTWTPTADKTPRAVLILIHGLGEHAGRYQHIVRATTEAGTARIA